MNVTFDDYGPNVPDKERYEHGVDYLSHEFDLGFEDAFYLVSQLKNNRSSVQIGAPMASVLFYIFDNLLHVQIDGCGDPGFWHGSNLDLPTAREILRVATDGCEDFGMHIPGTDREWDVY